MSVKRYSESFKIEAVKQITESGYAKRCVPLSISVIILRNKEQ